jgi:hypothetical protein
MIGYFNLLEALQYMQGQVIGYWLHIRVRRNQYVPVVIERRSH